MDAFQCALWQFPQIGFWIVKWLQWKSLYDNAWFPDLLPDDQRNSTWKCSGLPFNKNTTNFKDKYWSQRLPKIQTVFKSSNVNICIEWDKKLIRERKKWLEHLNNALPSLLWPFKREYHFNFIQIFVLTRTNKWWIRMFDVGR